MERLDKLVANRACVSRREAAALIRRGAVLLDGQPAKPDAKCGPGNVVTLGGKPLDVSAFVWLMLNKPAGVLSATRDREKTGLDLLPPELRRKGLFPAGRLDRDTEGLLLITNDGQGAHRLLSPKNHVAKTYHATLDAPADIPALAALFAAGVDLGEGERSTPAVLRELEAGGHPLLELTIYEGVFHQVKRMFRAGGRKVTRLRRVSVGGLTLDPSLAPGECRPLTAAEEEALFS